MKFRLEHSFPAPIEAVETAMVDPEFLEATRLPDVGPPRVLSREEHGPTVTVRVRYEYTGALDSLARRVLRTGDVAWVQETTLDRAGHREEFRIVPDVYPERFACGGTVELRQEGVDTVRVIDGELRIKVPIFGGRAEAMIVPGTKRRLDEEAHQLGAWLAERTGG